MFIYGNSCKIKKSPREGTVHLSRGLTPTAKTLRP